ncbi:MAG TPA: TIGR01777 family oxidoreductase [Micromonosporaceae bacterium]|nr:TIGR01777 family oxidoreductase [Micromonosporaceae bacterium]
MRVVIGGAGGFLGTALSASLRADGHEVVRLVRRTPEGPGEVSWSPADGALDPAALAGADVAVNLAGVGVGDRRWTAAYKQQIRASRVDSTVTLSHALAAANGGPRVLLNASAIGYYGDRGDEVLDENAPPGDGFFPDVCRAWEAATQVAEEAGVRVCNLRSGLVVGPGGMMKRLVPLYRAGIGGPLGGGRHYMSWISLADHVAAVRFLMTAQLSGPVNLTAPKPVPNAVFSDALGKALRRPSVLPAPAFGVRLVLGEFANNVLESARVVPRVLLDAGYVFGHPEIDGALRWAVTRPS